MVGAPVDKIVSIIRDNTYRYSKEMLPDGAARHLALFISRGQVDMPQYIDYATKTARGARFYQVICAVCHGFDGKKMNFKTADNPEYIGTVAQKNPQETLHKTLNG
jgi:thiosulfate dehydrogenase